MYRSVKVLLCMCILCVHDTWRASCEHTKLVSQSKIYKQLWIKSCWYLITNFMKVLSFSCKDTTTSLRSPLLKTKPNCFIKASLSCDTLDFLYGMGCQTQLWSAEVKSSPIGPDHTWVWQSMLFWEVGWAVSNFNKTRWLAVISLVLPGLTLFNFWGHFWPFWKLRHILHFISVCNKTFEPSSHISPNCRQYLIPRSISVPSTSHNHSLVQLSSSRAAQPPGKSLLWTEQHF